MDVRSGFSRDQITSTGFPSVIDQKIDLVRKKKLVFTQASFKPPAASDAAVEDKGEIKAGQVGQGLCLFFSGEKELVCSLIG